MKQLIWFFTCISSTLALNAMNLPPTYERGNTPDGKSAEYLKVVAAKGMGGEFTLKLRDQKEFPAPKPNWQQMFNTDNDINLFGLKLKAFRVLQDGSFQERGQKNLVSQYRTGAEGPIVSYPASIPVRYDSAGQKSGDHYRIYCVKTYVGATQTAQNYREEYVNCSDILFYDNVEHNIPYGGGGKAKDYKPLSLRKFDDWNQ